MMKRIFLVVQFLLLFNTVFAQSYKENISASFKIFGDFMRAGEIEKAFDYVHTDLFEIVPRADLEKITKQLLNSGEFTVKFLDFNVQSFYEPKIVEGKHYVVFKYRSGMLMKFNELDTLPVEEKNSKLSSIKTAFVNQFGSENVSLDEKTGFFKINSEKKSVAISKDGKTDWKFINVETEQRLVMEKILPKAIRDEVF